MPEEVSHPYEPPDQFYDALQDAPKLACAPIPAAAIFVDGKYVGHEQLYAELDRHGITTADLDVVMPAAVVLIDRANVGAGDHPRAKELVRHVLAVCVDLFDARDNGESAAEARARHAAQLAAAFDDVADRNLAITVARLLIQTSDALVPNDVLDRQPERVAVRDAKRFLLAAFIAAKRITEHAHLIGGAAS